MQNLNINLLINPKCELVAIDNTIYRNLRYGDNQYVDDIKNHVNVEFLVDHHNNVISDSISISHNCKPRQELVDGNISIFRFPFDGVFVYYKYLIPNTNHLLKTNSANEEYYKSSNQIFYHDGSILFAKDDYDTLSDLLSNSTKINDLIELWDLQGTQTFSFQKVIFSACNLQKCLVYLQRKLLNQSNDCGCNKSDKSIRNNRDFLFSTLYLLDYLKDRGNYEEAQRILENISECTGSICSELKLECNCGKAVR
jgi:hypothetical protein